MKYIAHRGLRTKDIPENTLEAFKNAINNPDIAGFEFDIRKTKDDYFVVNHNVFIKGELIKTKTYRYLKKKYHLPLLTEVLSLDTNKIMLVEIKDINIPYKKLIRIFKKFPNKNIYVMSFHNWVIDKLCEYHAPIKLGILNYVLNSESDYHLEFIGLLNNLATRNLINAYQNRNVEVFLYGIINEDKDIIYDDVYYIVDEVPNNN